MVEHDGDLLIGVGDQRVRAVGARRVVGRVAGRVEVAALLRLGAVGERALAAGRRGTRYPVFCRTHD